MPRTFLIVPSDVRVRDLGVTISHSPTITRKGKDRDGVKDYGG
jgi:hypothetical protein